MVGTNKILMNEATVKAAIQEYMDKRYSEGVSPGPKITAVTWMCDVNGMSFHVTLEGRTA